MKFTADTEKLYKAALDVSKCVDRYSARPCLRCIEIVCDGDKVTLTAMNEYMLAQRTLTVTDSVPGKALVEAPTLLRVLKPFGGTIKTSIESDQTAHDLYVFQNTFSCVVPLRFENDYIDYKHFFSDPRDQIEIFVNPKLLATVANATADKYGYVCLQIPKNPILPIILKNCPDAFGDFARGIVLPADHRESNEAST